MSGARLSVSIRASSSTDLVVPKRGQHGGGMLGGERNQTLRGGWSPRPASTLFGVRA